MAWFKHKQAQEEAPHDYDFAKIVQAARENDPSRFKRLQEAFKKITPHKRADDSK